MAVSLVSFQSIARGGSVTIPSGTNRVVVLTIGAYSWASNTVSGWSLGGATIANSEMVLGKRQLYDTGGNYYASEIYYVKEANIDAGAQTVSVTFNQTMSGTLKIECMTLSGVSQASPVEATNTRASASSVDPWSQSFAVAAGNGPTSVSV
jgi:hypothetical protein